MFEAAEVMVPSTFIIVDAEISDPPDVDLAGGLLQMAFKVDSAGWGGE